MTKYIKYDEAFINKATEACASDASAMIKIIDLLHHYPAADVVEVKHGYWKVHSQSETAFVCSECALNVSGFEKRWINYCPNCGAKMDLKEGVEK